MLKPELDAAVFGGECVAFPLGGSAYMIIGDLVENSSNLSFLHDRIELHIYIRLKNG